MKRLPLIILIGTTLTGADTPAAFGQATPATPRLSEEDLEALRSAIREGLIDPLTVTVPLDRVLGGGTSALCQVQRHRPRG